RGLSARAVARRRTDIAPERAPETAVLTSFLTSQSRDPGPEWNWLAAATLVCGIASARMVNLIGEIYLGEVLLVQLALIVLMVQRERRLMAVPGFGTLVQLAVLMLAGYVLSDLYRDTHAAQFLRGWARVVLQVLDFMALAI